jgi:REP element-mobilizing transposase RayT
VPIEEVTEKQRQYGKVVVLACGYGVSADGLARQAVGYGLHLKPRESWRLVDRYHALFPSVRETFNALDKWVPRVIEGEVDEYEIARCVWKRNKVGSLLTCTLPSGRKIRYMKPSVKGSITYQGRVGATAVRKKLWGGEFWSDDYYLNTVSERGNWKTVEKYVANQGKTMANPTQLTLWH